MYYAFILLIGAERLVELAVSRRNAHWSFANGEKMADELDYVPMPAPVVKVIQAEWKNIKDASGKPVY